MTALRQVVARSSSARRRPLGGAAFVLALGVLVAGDATAHLGAVGVVKERMDLMEALGRASKALAAMAKGEAPFDPEAAAAHARTVREAAPRIIGLFPEGSAGEPSEALPTIWTDPGRLRAGGGGL